MPETTTKYMIQVWGTNGWKYSGWFTPADWIVDDAEQAKVYMDQFSKAGPGKYQILSVTTIKEVLAGVDTTVQAGG